MASVLCFDDRVTQDCKPLLHDLCNAIANYTGTAGELCRHGSEEAATPEDAALDVGQPDIAELPKSQQTLGRFEGWFDDFADKDFTCGFDGGDLQVFL